MVLLLFSVVAEFVVVIVQQMYAIIKIDKALEWASE